MMTTLDDGHSATNLEIEGSEPFDFSVLEVELEFEHRLGLDISYAPSLKTKKGHFLSVEGRRFDEKGCLWIGLKSHLESIGPK